MSESAVSAQAFQHSPVAPLRAHPCHAVPYLWPLPAKEALVQGPMVSMESCGGRQFRSLQLLQRLSVRAEDAVDTDAVPCLWAGEGEEGLVQAPMGGTESMRRQSYVRRL